MPLEKTNCFRNYFLMHAIRLTPRELDVANGILDGLSYKLIAAKYDISLSTVRMNIRSIYRKLNINSKSELFNLKSV